MLYLDGIGLSFLVKEVKDKILNYKLTKIFQYDRSSLSLFFGKNNLLFQVKDNSTIFYLKNEKDMNTDFQSNFLLSLKKYLQNYKNPRSFSYFFQQNYFHTCLYFYLYDMYFFTKKHSIPKKIHSTIDKNRHRLLRWLSALFISLY